MDHSIQRFGILCYQLLVDVEVLPFYDELEGWRAIYRAGGGISDYA